MKFPTNVNEKSLTSAEDIALVRSRELSELIRHFGSQQQTTEFYDWITEFSKLNQEHPRNKEIRDLFANSLIDATRLFGERKSFADMLYIIDELQELYKNNFEFEILSELLSEALAIAISYLKGSWDAEGTSSLLKRMRDLLKKHPKNELIALNYAKSYSSAINRFCSDRHNFTCDKLLFEFRMFANKNRENEDIQYEFAQALTSIIGTLARESRIDELEHILTELRKIASNFTSSEKIQLLLTRGTILSSLVEKQKN